MIDLFADGRWYRQLFSGNQEEFAPGDGGFAEMAAIAAGEYVQVSVAIPVGQSDTAIMEGEQVQEFHRLFKLHRFV